MYKEEIDEAVEIKEIRKGSRKRVAEIFRETRKERVRSGHKYEIILDWLR